MKLVLGFISVALSTFSVAHSATATLKCDSSPVFYLPGKVIEVSVDEKKLSVERRFSEIYHRGEPTGRLKDEGDFTARYAATSESGISKNYQCTVKIAAENCERRYYFTTLELFPSDSDRPADVNENAKWTCTSTNY